MKRTAEQWRKDLTLGMLIGLGLAVAFSVMGAVRYLASPSDFETQYDMSFSRMLLLYWFGGLLGGFCIAVLRPLRRSPWGMFVIGFIAGLPLATAVMILTTRRDEWFTSGLVYVLLAATLEGGGLAVLLDKTNTWKQ
jgi:peptidoglycan/LPS O-acetylase OafA/YrhL